MIYFIREKLTDPILRQIAPPEDLPADHEAVDPDALTIGFARRFATYKRASLIFRDAKRLAKILGNPARPVQLVFAGKAHPQDMGGQAFAQEIYRHAKEQAFRGRVVIVDDYDM